MNTFFTNNQLSVWNDPAITKPETKYTDPDFSYRRISDTVLVKIAQKTSWSKPYLALAKYVECQEDEQTIPRHLWQVAHHSSYWSDNIIGWCEIPTAETF